MQILVTNRAGIEAGAGLNVPHIVISIRCPGSPKPRIPPSPTRIGLLSLAFSDAEPVDVAGLDDVQLFTQEYAEIIRDFVGRAYDAQGIIVHCEAGMSRSPAVAAALAEHFGQNQEAAQFFRRCTPNRHVYGTLRQTLFETTRPNRPAEIRRADGARNSIRAARHDEGVRS